MIKLNPSCCHRKERIDTVNFLWGRKECFNSSDLVFNWILVIENKEGSVMMTMSGVWTDDRK
jgi:hypothetical protein